MPKRKAPRRKRGNGEGSIIQRKDGRWAAVVHIGYNREGKRRRKVLYGATAEAVQKKLVETQNRMIQGLPVTSEVLTVGDFLTSWLEHTSNDVRPRTLQSYEFLCRRHIIPALGKIRLTKLNAAHVQQFLHEAAQKGRLGKKKGQGETEKKLSPRTVRLMLAVLRKALSQAEKWDLVTRNVAKLVDGPKVEKPEIHPFSMKEAKAVLKAADGERLEALFAVALGLGLRQGEVLALRWTDIDLEKGKLQVRATLQRIEKEWRLLPPKSEKSRRTIMLPSTLKDTLRRHRARQLEERLAAGELWQQEIEDLVFTNVTGSPIHQTDLLRQWNAIQIAAEVPRRRFHDARHSAASILLAQGAQPRIIQEILGHAQIRTTMDLYAHVYEESLDKAAEMMEAAIFSSK